MNETNPMTNMQSFENDFEQPLCSTAIHFDQAIKASYFGDIHGCHKGYMCAKCVNASADNFYELQRLYGNGSVQCDCGKWFATYAEYMQLRKL